MDVGIGGYRPARAAGRRGLLCLSLAIAALSVPLGDAGASEHFGGYDGSRDTAQLAARGDVQEFDIAAQPLAQALMALGEQSGLQVTFDPALVAGRTSPPVSGNLTPESALLQLLDGTRFTFRFIDDRTAVIEALGDVEGLAPIRVEGEGAVDGTIGYVATRSSTGSKTDTPLIENPQSISVVTREQIEDQGAQTVSEALRYTSGVYTQPFGVDTRYDQINVRGFFGHDLGDYRDGLRQVSNSFAYFRTEPYGLERLDVLKGSTSALYGQNSPGGLVNRISKKPLAETRLEGIVQYDPTLDRIQGGVDLNASFDENGVLLGRFVGFGRKSDNPQFEEENDDRIFAAPSITINPTDDTTITVLGEYMKDFTSYNFYYVDPAGDLTRIWTGEPDFDRFDQVQHQVGYQFEHRVTDGIAVRQNLRYSDLNIQNDYVFGTTADTAGDIVRIGASNEEDLRAFAVDTHGQFDFETGPVSHTALAGIDYLYSDWEQDTAFGSAPSININAPVYGQAVDASAFFPSLDTNQTLRQLGVYGQEQMKLFEQLVLTFGGRADWTRTETKDNLANTKAETKDNGVFTGRAGITYLFDFGLAPYFSYSTSFLPTTGTDVTGSTFEPTEGEQFEFGVKYEPDFFDGFFTAAVFDLTQSNVLTVDPNNPAFDIQIGEVRSRGFEVEGKVSLMEGLDLLAAYTFNDVEVTESTGVDRGNTPVITPKHIASAWANYTIPSGDLAGLGLGAGARYVGTSYRTADNTLTNDPYVLFDLAAHYEFEEWRIAVNVANLLDNEYFICNTATSCYWGQGRTVLTTLRYRW